MKPMIEMGVEGEKVLRKSYIKWNKKSIGKKYIKMRGPDCCIQYLNNRSTRKKTEK